MSSFITRPADSVNGYNKPKPTIMFPKAVQVPVVNVLSPSKSRKATPASSRAPISRDSSSSLSPPPSGTVLLRKVPLTASKVNSSTASGKASMAKKESKHSNVSQPQGAFSPQPPLPLTEIRDNSSENLASLSRKDARGAADAFASRFSESRPIRPPSNASSSPLSSPPRSLPHADAAQIDHASQPADLISFDEASAVELPRHCEQAEDRASQGSSPLSSLSSSPLTSASSSPSRIPAKRKFEVDDSALSCSRSLLELASSGEARDASCYTKRSSSPLSTSLPTFSSSTSSKNSPITKSSEPKKSFLAVPDLGAVKKQRARSSPSTPASDASILPPKTPKRAKTTTPEPESTSEYAMVIQAAPMKPTKSIRSKLKRPKGDAYDFDDSDASSGPSKIRKAGKTRRKRLTDTTLPPKRGTHIYDERTALRGDSPSREATASLAILKKIRPTSAKRKLWAEEGGDIKQELKTSATAVEELMAKVGYATYFKSPLDANFELENRPMCTLEYPAPFALDEYLLAKPKDPDHYDPMLDIEDTLTTFIKDYLPKEYRHIFGPLSEDVLTGCIDFDDDDADASSVYPASTAPPSTVPSSNVSASSSRESSPLSDAPHEFPTSPPQSSSAPSSPPPTSSPPPFGLMRALDKARKNADGPAYLSALNSINTVIRSLKNDPDRGNILASVPRSWAERGLGIPESVVHRIIEETYQRCVGPKVDKLRDYKAFSSNVYGELTPAFVSHIIALTGLHSDCLFLDLGSGVGNVCLQVALQTGCRAFGIEQREDTAEIASEQERQVRTRCKLWGVSMGEVELVKGDMTASPRVDELMSKADVVLVNNYVFSEPLNAAIAAKFLDLKDDAIVISLKPFQTGPALTERNFDDIAAIFTVTKHPYREGTVSWSGGGGTFYAQQVDRDRYRKAREHFEDKQLKRMGRGRRGRSEGV